MKEKMKFGKKVLKSIMRKQNNNSIFIYILKDEINEIYNYFLEWECFDMEFLESIIYSQLI